MAKKPQSVSEYIEAAPKEKRAKLRELRKIIRAAAPKAEEKISYGMPYYAYGGRLAYFAWAKEHVGLYVPPPILAEHAKEIKKYKSSKATIQLPLSDKLPTSLIKKLLKARMKKNEEKDALTVCSRGHKFRKDRAHPVCPVCWPGRYKRKVKVK